MDGKNIDIGTHVQPMPGHVRAGDFALAVCNELGAVLILIDIAGHGNGAHAVGRRIVPSMLRLAQESHPNPATLLVAAHELLHHTQGAAVGVATIQHGHTIFAGIGNVCCFRTRFDENRFATRKRLNSRDGLVGVRFRTPSEQKAQVAVGDLVVLHSDGIRQSPGEWRTPGMYAGSASSICRAIVTEHGRDSDDASCIVARVNQSAAGRNENG